MNRDFLIKIIIVIFFSSGCAISGQKIKTESSKNVEPEWIKEIPQGKEFFYVVGFSTKAESLEKARESARKSAHSQLSEYVGIRVQSSVKIKSSSENDLEIDEEIDSETQSEIRGAEVVDEYFVKKTREAGSYYEETFNYYVLFRLRKEEVEKERANQKEGSISIANSALNGFIKAQNYYKKNKTTDAFNEIVNSHNILAGVADNVEVAKKIAEIRTVGELKTEVQTFYDKMVVLSKTVSLKINFEDQDNKLYINQVKSSVGSGLSKNNISVSTDSEKCRFKLFISISEKAGGEVYDKKAMYSIISYKIKDLWSEIEFDSGIVEEKAFNKNAESAFKEAMRIACEKTGIRVSEKIEKHIMQ